MLEIDRGDVCRNIGEKLKALVEQTGIANMQRKMTALEMDYVKKTKDRERYLKTAGRFYELTEIVEQENRSMIVNMLYLRKSLERARERLIRHVEKIPVLVPVARDVMADALRDGHTESALCIALFYLKRHHILPQLLRALADFLRAHSTVNDDEFISAVARTENLITFHLPDQALYRVKRRGRNRLCMTDIHGREIEV